LHRWLFFEVYFDSSIAQFFIFVKYFILHSNGAAKFSAKLSIQWAGLFFEAGFWVLFFGGCFFGAVFEPP